MFGIYSRFTFTILLASVLHGQVSAPTPVRGYVDSLQVETKDTGKGSLAFNYSFADGSDAVIAAGFRGTVEYVSFICEIPAGTAITQLVIGAKKPGPVSSNRDFFYHLLTPTKQAIVAPVEGSTWSTQVYIVSQSVTVDVNEGELIYGFVAIDKSDATIAFTNSPPASCSGKFSGKIQALDTATPTSSRRKLAQAPL
jgi:hypothetical protein